MFTEALSDVANVIMLKCLQSSFFSLISENSKKY